MAWLTPASSRTTTTPTSPARTFAEARPVKAPTPSSPSTSGGFTMPNPPNHTMTDPPSNHPGYPDPNPRRLLPIETATHILDALGPIIRRVHDSAYVAGQQSTYDTAAGMSATLRWAAAQIEDELAGFPTRGAHIRAWWAVMRLRDMADNAARRHDDDPAS